MTWERFCSLAETWGGNIDRWPDQERTQARQLADTVKGREVLDRAQAFDRLLAYKPALNPNRAASASFAVIQRIAAQKERRIWTFRPLLRSTWLAPAASLTCSFVIGISLAFMVPYERQQPEQALLSMVLDNTTLPMIR
jgi:hypothetical protein